MPSWLPRVRRRIRNLAIAGRVRFTLKALQELAELALDWDDALDVLRRLSDEDAQGRLRSVDTGEWMYIFKPTIGGLRLYLKVIVRDDCIVVSFHEDEAGHDESA